MCYTKNGWRGRVRTYDIAVNSGMQLPSVLPAMKIKEQEHTHRRHTTQNERIYVYGAALMRTQSHMSLCVPLS